MYMYIYLRFSEQAAHVGRAPVVGEQPQRCVRGARVVGGRVRSPEPCLAEAVALVVCTHHPVVLDDERQNALALRGALDEVLEAI